MPANGAAQRTLDGNGDESRYVAHAVGEGVVGVDAGVGEAIEQRPGFAPRVAVDDGAVVAEVAR